MPQKRLRTGCLPAIETLERRALPSAAPGVLHPTYRLAHHSGLAPLATAGATGVTPAQMRHAYGADAISFGTTAGDGSGQTIAIVGAYDDPNAASDLHNFDLAFGLPDPPTFTKLNENGGTALPGADTAAKPDTWELEESLDMEWAHVMAPRANLVMYEASSPSLNDLIAHAVNSARNNPNVSVVSMSFGGSEFSGETSYDGYFTTPSGHAGITFMASTGDNGSPAGYPAYSPNVVAVGGTTLSINSAGTYLGESGWSGSGGGASTQEFQPAYQNSVQSTGSRTAPDVSLDADPNSGVPVYDSFDNGASTPWIQVGGTSLSSPMWAGLLAVADQGRTQYALGSLDGATQTLPKLYQLSSADFHDVTAGSNGGFSAGPGYDLVTGRGTPIANLLVPALAPAPAPAPSTAASFVRADTSTQGSWTGAYGSDGYWNFGGAQSLPGYAQVTPSGQQSWTWDPSTTDPRALQTSPGSSSRLAACLYSGTSFSLDVNLTDGKQHQVSLYMLDWDSTARSQTVTVADAATGAVLDTRNVTGFHDGQWLVWDLSGQVKITFTTTGILNSVVGGIMFDAKPAAGAPGTASFLNADTSSQGTWTGTYGSDGYWNFGGAKSLPAYAQVLAVNQQSWTWAASTSDPRAIQTAPAAATRLAACLYSTSSFTLDVNLTDAQTHRVALYMVDWDSFARGQTVTITDANTGAVLDTRSVSGFHNGQWLVWNLSGHVKITFTTTAGIDAVLSGMMFG